MKAVLGRVCDRVRWVPIAFLLVACGSGAKSQPAPANPSVVAGAADAGEVPTESGAEGADASASPALAELPPATDSSADKPAGEAAPAAALQGNEEGARALLLQFVAQNADHLSLTSSLRPNAADYKAMFDAKSASKVESGQAKEWNSRKAVIKPKAGQSDVKLWAATGAELAKGTGNAKEFPAEYKKVGKHLAPTVTFYRFKFVEPGKDTGTAYDGLAFVNAHWVIAPKPWRALEGKGGGEEEEKPAASKPKPKGKGKGKKK